MLSVSPPYHPNLFRSKAQKLNLKHLVVPSLLNKNSWRKCCHHLQRKKQREINQGKKKKKNTQTSKTALFHLSFHAYQTPASHRHTLSAYSSLDAKPVSCLHTLLSSCISINLLTLFLTLYNPHLLDNLACEVLVLFFLNFLLGLRLSFFQILLIQITR